MLIKKRDRALKAPLAIRDDKILLVLDWLLEFRFSTVEILSERIESNSINTNRFFNRLESIGFIKFFSNVHTSGKRFLMLTTSGASFLEGHGRDISRASTRVQNLGKYSQVAHDIGVQKLVLLNIDGYAEVVWDRHIDMPKGIDRPDFILRPDTGNYWVAFEYERWRKERKRIYYSLNNHASALTAGVYRGVYFVFQESSDCAYYKKCYEELEWPEFERVKSSGRLRPLSRSLKPDGIKNLRKCFVFTEQPLSI
jgi:hypothetical protein